MIRVYDGFNEAYKIEIIDSYLVIIGFPPTS